MSRILSREIINACDEVLDINDWYFGKSFNKAEPEELRSCFYYEYLRESPVVRRLWTRWRDFSIWSEVSRPASINRYFLVRKCLERRLKLQTRQFEKCLRIMRSPWPDKPWQDLSAEEREKRSWDEKVAAHVIFKGAAEKVKEKIRNEEFEARVIPNASVQQIKRLADDLPDLAMPERVFIVLIPEGANRQQVEQVFSRAVSKFSKDNKDYFEESEGGRGRLADQLRRLGALRLRKLKAHCRGKGLTLTDELLVDYQRHCLRRVLKQELRSLSAEGLETEVEKRIPYRDWRHLGKCERAAQKTLDSIVVSSPKARRTS